jgi:hypothetical protein
MLSSFIRCVPGSAKIKPIIIMVSNMNGACLEGGGGGKTYKIKWLILKNK